MDVTNHKNRKPKMKTILRTSLLTALATGVCSSTLAYDNAKNRQDGIRPYVGGSYGRVDVNADQFEDDSDHAISIYTGVDIGKTFGIELGYVDLGETQNEFFTGTTDGLELAGLVHLLNTEYFNLYAKGGLFQWDTAINTPLGNASNDGNELFWAVGSDIYLTNLFALRIEYTRYDVELEDDEVGALASGSDFNLNKLSLGAKLTF